MSRRYAIIARDQAGLMNPGKAVHFAELSPDYTVTTAKVNLGTIRYETATLPPPLTFLMTVRGNGPKAQDLPESALYD